MGEDSCDAECSPAGKCDPSHPLHCCHIVVTESLQVGPRTVKFFYVCVKCDRVSRTKITVIVGPEPKMRGPKK